MPVLKSDTLKAKIGLSGPALNRIPGPPPLIPDHRMLRCIGQGSYGEVWLARNAVGTWRAIKVVFRQNFKDARPYEREFAGIQSYEPISRTNEGLIDVLQIGRNDAEGYFYYVMELADPADAAPDEEPCLEKGPDSSVTADPRQARRDELDPDGYIPKTLSRVIQQRGRLNYEECITLGLTLNLALGDLHRHGLIHRDVKPSNIIFVNGVPKLTDIGLVTDLAGAQSFVGTEGFIPPEGPNSPQADLYALGKVLYEASMGKDRNEFPEPVSGLGVDAESKALMELNAVLVRACAPDPKQRYQRAEEMNADLALLHNGESVRQKHALKRRLKLMTRAGVVTIALIVLGVVPYALALREARLAKASAKLEAQQRLRAQTEAAKSLEVAQFLKDMLKGAEPSVALGRDNTMLREILDQTAQRIGRDLQSQPEVEAELRSILGNVYLELGQFNQAESMLRRALQSRIQLAGEDNLVVAQGLSDLSMALASQGQLKEAEDFQRRALAIRTRLLGEGDLAVAESLGRLGIIFSDEAKLSEAEKFFRQALAIRQKALGPEHVKVAESMSGVANMLNAQGQWAEAEEIFRDTLAIDRKLLGPRHPDSVSALNGLVQSLLAQGKLVEAESDAREGLALQKELLGLDHPSVAGSFTRLARILERAGKLNEAKTNLEQALSIWTKRLGNQDPGVAETLSALFDILLAQGDHESAERIFQQVLTAGAQADRPNKGLLNVCGNYLARTGRWSQAAEQFSKLVQSEPGNHHAYQALAALYVQMDDLPDYRQLCEQIRAQFGSVTNDPRIADRMAKSCLILPPEGEDLTVEARLAQSAVTFDTNAAANPWFQFCKGLAEYRSGNFGSATDWMQKVLLRAKDGSSRDVEAYMVLTMADYRLQHLDQARQAFGQGTELARKRLREVSSGDIDSGWTDWILAHALMREAGNLLASPTGSPQ